MLKEPGDTFVRTAGTSGDEPGAAAARDTGSGSAPPPAAGSERDTLTSRTGYGRETLEHGGILAIVIDALIPDRPGGWIHDEHVAGPNP